MGCFWSRPLSPLGALVGRLSESLGLTALSLASACAQAEALGLRGTFSLVVAIDFTRSNEHNGERTFARASLHAIADEGGGAGTRENHYEAVIASLAPLQALRARALGRGPGPAPAPGQEPAPELEPEPILVYGFGDAETRTGRGLAAGQGIDPRAQGGVRGQGQVEAFPDPVRVETDEVTSGIEQGAPGRA